MFNCFSLFSMFSWFALLSERCVSYHTLTDDSIVVSLNLRLCCVGFIGVMLVFHGLLVVL